MHRSLICKLVSAALVATSPAALFAQQSAPDSSKVEVTPAVTATVTTTGGTSGTLPVFSGSSSIVNSKLYYANGFFGIGKTPAASLDIVGTSLFGGQAVLERTGVGTTSAFFSSHSLQFQSSAYNSSSKVAVSPYLEFEAEPTGNNTASPAATLHLLSGTGTGAAAETGFYLNSNGTIHFATAQTFPIAAGPTGPKGATGATGPQGPTGPKGATGATGATGGISLPYATYGYENGYPVFELQNLGIGTGYYNTPDGIEGIGGTSVAGNGYGGSGVVGLGGPANANSASDYTIGGYGVKGVGGSGNPYYGNYAGSLGGPGGVFSGGPSGGSGGVGGYGVEVFDSYNNSIAVYAVGKTAGYFIGDVDVYGTLYKSSGAFKIDHPVDPENKYLVHSFVESPDMKNVYDGVTVTDGGGTAVVTLPDWFESLNRDFRYQLTTVGQRSQTWVEAEISNNQFTIRTDHGGVKVSWQVTGIRQDAWANAHRLPTEVEKNDQEKGHYIHPELFGHKEQRAIGELERPGAPRDKQ